MDPRRRSTRINSPRYLALRHAHRLLAAKDVEEVVKDPEVLLPGNEKLYSYFVPGLEAGWHTINVTQNISVDSTNALPPKTSTQRFNVIAPRFVLPSNSIYSVYPPQGHGDRPEVLPHVVLSDPMLPWERIGSLKAEKVHPPDYDSNRVPWLALLVFTQDELRLDSAVLGGEGSIFKNTVQYPQGATQNSTLSTNMLVSDLLKVTETATPVTYDPATDGANATTDVVFLKPNLFTSLFTTYDTNGEPPAPGQTSPDVSRYRFLAHVRDIATDGMAEAGVADDARMFGIVVSHRTGPLTFTQPTAVITHLVSIEGVEEMAFPITADFVALSSLHSWSYTCLPPGSFNVADTFITLGSTLNVLRPTLTDDEIAQIKATKPVGDRVARRLLDGFSTTRYRVQTGEVIAAFVRGPFTPTVVPAPLTPGWTSLSTSGSDLQILDQEVGLMDLTYSVAWELGRTMALADQSFTAALSRVRKQIFDIAMNEAQASALRKHSAYKSRAETLATLADSINTLVNLNKSGLLKKPEGMVNRWRRASLEPLDLTLKGDEIDPVIASHLEDAAYTVSSSPNKDQDPSKPYDNSTPYDETNTPYSTDWLLVLGWMLDRLHLVNVPAHYYITDPRHLPAESLRFFHIDANWVNALLDGGLSLANHLENDDDQVRTAIKKAFNRYLTFANPDLKYAPPVPKYGFLLRSELVTKFPDLVITTSPGSDPTGAPMILRHENIDTGVMLCLFNQEPAEGVFESLTLAQPPHQQSFAAAKDLDIDHIEMDYKRIYTIQTPSDPNRHEAIFEYLGYPGKPNGHGANFVWSETSSADDVRTICFPNFADDLYSTLTTEMAKINPTWFTEIAATAALIGIQLNNPCWQLVIPIKAQEQESVPSEPGPRTLPIRWKPGFELPLAAPQLQKPKRPVAPHPPFNKRTRCYPLMLRQPPPHYRIPRSHPKLAAPAERVSPEFIGKTFRMGPNGPAGPPQYDYAAYPADTPGAATIPMTTLPQDLIFSIVYDTGSQDFNLTSVTLTIPLGAQGLMMNYNGPGATMLSNLRLNVIPQFSKAKNAMVIQLLPRSRKKVVPDSHVHEMSFLLSGVVVNVAESQYTVTVGVVEQYQSKFQYSFSITVGSK